MADERKPVNGGPNHWERWRGEVNARLEELRGKADDYAQQCRSCRRNVDVHFDDLYKTLHAEVKTLNDKVQKIETRIAWIAGIAALAGSGLHGIVEWAMKMN